MSNESLAKYYPLSCSNIVTINKVEAYISTGIRNAMGKMKAEDARF